MKISLGIRYGGLLSGSSRPLRNVGPGIFPFRPEAGLSEIVFSSIRLQTTPVDGPRKSKTPGPGKLPGRYLQFQKRYPTVHQAYDALSAATMAAGPLDAKTRALVKLAIAIGGQMEGAVHSHTRRAVEAGCSTDEIRHTVLLATTTIGFPSMMKTLSWVEDVIGDQ